MVHLSIPSILHCTDHWLQFGRKDMDHVVHTKPLWKNCDDGKSPTCYDKHFRQTLCRTFPYHSVKTVRLNLNLTRDLLADQRYVVR